MFEDMDKEELTIPETDAEKLIFCDIELISCAVLKC